jgi:hypothetical protein
MASNENFAPAQEFGRREFLKKGLLWGGARTATFALGSVGGAVADPR